MNEFGMYGQDVNQNPANQALEALFTNPYGNRYIPDIPERFGNGLDEEDDFLEIDLEFCNLYGNFYENFGNPETFENLNNEAIERIRHRFTDSYIPGNTVNPFATRPYSPYYYWLTSELARYGFVFLPDWSDPRWTVGD